jgi:hypothetical protein
VGVRVPRGVSSGSQLVEASSTMQASETQRPHCLVRGRGVVDAVASRVIVSAIGGTRAWVGFRRAAAISHGAFGHLVSPAAATYRAAP